LRHALNHQARRHYRESRKMIVQMLLGQRHILNCHRRDIHLELFKLIDPNPAHYALTLLITSATRLSTVNKSISLPTSGSASNPSVETRTSLTLVKTSSYVIGIVPP